MRGQTASQGDDSAFSLQSGYATMGLHQDNHGLLFVADGAFLNGAPLKEGPCYHGSRT